MNKVFKKFSSRIFYLYIKIIQSIFDPSSVTIHEFKKKNRPSKRTKPSKLKHSALYCISLCLLHTILTDTPEVERGRRISVPPDKYLSPGSPLFSSLPRFTSLNSIHSAPSRSRKSSRGRANFPTTLSRAVPPSARDLQRRTSSFRLYSTPARGKTEKGEGAPRSAGPLK